MNCRAARRRLADLLLPDAPSSGRGARARERTRAHLETCSACSDAFAALQKTERLLQRVKTSGAGAAPVAPPADLARRIMERVQRVEEERAARGGFSLAYFSARWTQAALGACAVLLAVFGFALWQSAQQGGARGVLLAQRAENEPRASAPELAFEQSAPAQESDPARVQDAPGQPDARGGRVRVASAQTTPRAASGRAQTESAQGAFANNPRARSESAQASGARSPRAQDASAQSPFTLAAASEPVAKPPAGRAQAALAQRLAASEVAPVASLTGVPGVLNLEQLSGAELAALARAFATQRLGPDARFATPGAASPLSSMSQTSRSAARARGRAANVAEPVALGEPGAGWQRSAPGARGVFTAPGGAREAVAQGPRSGGATPRAPSQREYCALTLSAPACSTWKSLLLGLAARNADAFVAEAEAVPAASRTRWLEELARTASQRGARANIAAYLREHANERARKLAAHFE